MSIRVSWARLEIPEPLFSGARPVVEAAPACTCTAPGCQGGQCESPVKKRSAEVDLQIDLLKGSRDL